MNEAEQKEMAELGITAETTVTFMYKNHKYQKFSDARAYAKLDQARNDSAGPGKEDAP